MTKKSKAALLTQANIIKNETISKANTAIRVGQMSVDTIDSVLFDDDIAVIPWNMSTNAFPAGGKSGQHYYGTEESTRTTLEDTAGNVLPSKVLAIATQDNPTTNAHFLFINIIF